MTEARVREAIDNALHLLDPDQGGPVDVSAANMWLRTTLPPEHPNYLTWEYVEETLGPSVSDELLEYSRELRALVERQIRERGVTVDVSRLDKALAAILGEQPFREERDREFEEAVSADVTAGETCARCEVMDGETVTLTEREGRPYCPRCHTDGSGSAL